MELLVYLQTIAIGFILFTLAAMIADRFARVGFTAAGATAVITGAVGIAAWML